MKTWTLPLLLAATLFSTTAFANEKTDKKSAPRKPSSLNECESTALKLAEMVLDNAVAGIPNARYYDA